MGIAWRLGVPSASVARGGASVRGLLSVNELNELRVLFDRSAGALTFRLVPSGGSEATTAMPFETFLSEEDFGDLRWYLEEFLIFPDYGSRVRADRVEAALEDWGKRLHAQLFGDGDHRELLNALLDGEAPRLLTIGTEDAELLRIPWELLRDRRSPLGRRGVIVRRQLQTAGKLRRHDTGRLPLRILLVVSRPDDAGFIDPRNTTQGMLDALEPLGEGVIIDFCRPATLGRMEGMLAAAKRQGAAYHLVHFNGHGTFLRGIKLGALCFEKGDEQALAVKTDLVGADRLGDLLAAYEVPLVVLEACHGAEIGHDTAFRSVAPRLLEAGVGSVLAMSHAVHVEATRILLARFYQALVGGATVGEALEEGRGALIATPDRWLEAGPWGKTVALRDWFLPNLYQRGKDPVLVPPGAMVKGASAGGRAAQRQPASGKEPGAFPWPPLHRFQGRAHELHQIERQFQNHRAVLLHAMGGMGKTSLAREGASWWTRTGLFPDGACFVSFEQGGGAERIVQVLGAYLEGASFEALSGEAQQKRARELFQHKQVLMVWDNFESVLPVFNKEGGAALYPEDVRAGILETFREWTAEPGGKGRILITCRPEETGLVGTQKTELFGLARADSLGLLVQVMKRAGVDTGDERFDREALGKVLNVVKDHPLSIELVGPHLKEMDAGGDRGGLWDAARDSLRGTRTRSATSRCWPRWSFRRRG